MLGLRYKGKDTAVPLKEISIKVTIKGFITNVESSLVYENEGEEAIETEFVFPVDEKSAVYRFEAKIDDRTIIAECQDKDKARETYIDAISMGHTAMMLSEDDSAGNIFQMKLGNLPPQKEAQLTFCYVLELALEPEDLITYTLPTVLNPRYQPQEYSDTDKEKRTLTSIAANIASKYTAFIGVDTESKLPVARQQIQDEENHYQLVMCGLMNTSTWMSRSAHLLSASSMQRKSSRISLPKISKVFNGLKNVFGRKKASTLRRSKAAASTISTERRKHEEEVP